MATEDTAGPGSRVAGIVCSLWVLVLGPSVLALEGRKEGEAGEVSSGRGWSSRVMILRMLVETVNNACMEYLRLGILTATELLLAN